MSEKPVICICGGGNAAHVMTGLASANERKPEVRVLTLYGNEAATWTEKLGADEIVISKHYPDGKVEEYATLRRWNEMSEKPVICICGGGNAAHVMTGLASANERKPEVRVLTLYGNEAETWTEKLGADEIVISKHYPDGKVEEIKGKPAFVTNDAKKAVTGANVLIFCVPAFAHQQYFEAIAPHVAPNTAIIGLPGQPGIEFQGYAILKEKAQGCVILSYETLPWACRITEFGRKADLLGTKETLTGSRVRGKNYQPGSEDPAKLLQSLLGPKPELSEASSYLELTMMAMTFAHPPLMYGRWKDWDGKPLKEKPLFYQGVDDYGVSLLAAVSDEVMNLAAAITKAKPQATMDNVESAECWLKRNYVNTISDPSTFRTALKTNSSYNGLVHPMKEISPGIYEPDFHYRYLSEDIPFGLAVVKGVAQIMKVATPITDEVMTWAQGRMGKEYMVGSELKGKDVKDTRAPQAFGFNTLEGLMAMV
ncbi:hypothetical protein ACOMHN_032285 [Nucella lapillus]